VLSNESKRKLPTKVLSFASEILCIHLEKRSKLRCNFILQLRFIRLFLLSYYHTAFSGIYCFSNFQPQKYHKNAIVPPTLQVDVEFSGHIYWRAVNLPIYLTRSTYKFIVFFALYTSAFYVIQGVLCDRERSLSCYFLPLCLIWEEGWKSKTKI